MHNHCCSDQIDNLKKKITYSQGILTGYLSIITITNLRNS